MSEIVRKWSIYWVIFVTLVSCSSAPVDPKSTNYKLNFESHDWEKISAEKSDYAFSKSKTNSIMMINSSCLKYKDVPLVNLQDSLLTGIDDLTIIEQEKINWAGRDAISLRAKGKIDGVTVNLMVRILKRDTCNYDFILIQPKEELLRKDSEDFLKMLESVKFNNND
ncbi:MAG: hypothetical protein U0T83_02430 [Bacteriovoracaceae bacterium]